MMRRAGVVLAVTGLILGFGTTEAQGQIRTQWQNSPHAGSMDNPEEQVRMNRTGCAHCHTAQGYHEVILAGQESTAPYEDATGLTCGACHLPRSEGAPRGALRAGTTLEACLGCHDEIVINTPDELSWTSHVGVFSGGGGSEVPGREYEIGSHAVLPDGCVTCHMAAAGEELDAERVGGHTFRVKTKGEEPVLLNTAGCVACHRRMTLERMAASQGEVRELLSTLAGLLPQKPVPGDPSATEPRYPSDPSLDETGARASFNYWLIQKDGSLGVHNPLYTRALLEHSIEEMRAGGG